MAIWWARKHHPTDFGLICGLKMYGLNAKSKIELPYKIYGLGRVVLPSPQKKQRIKNGKL